VAKVTNAFTTYGAKGNREDLSNSIYNIDPFDTPLMSAAKRRNVKNRTFDWQTEQLPNVDPNNAQVEGFVNDNSVSQPTVRQTNVTQISKRDATVSGSQEASDAAGKGSEMAHQMALKSKVLKSDMEVIMSSRQARVDGEDTTPQARKTESFAHAIARADNARLGTTHSAVLGVTGSTGAPLPTAANGAWVAVPNGELVAFSETMLGDGMQRAYENGASPDLLIVPPGIKRTVSTFEGRGISQVLVGKTEVVATVDIIATDFGRIKAVPSRWIPADLAMIVDPQYVAVSFFRNFRQFPIAKTGDAETRVILAEWGTETRNGLAHILFNGVKQGAVISLRNVAPPEAGNGNP
jgi:hypothetical protein